MENKCPRCGEPLITRTIKKEIGQGIIDYPVAEVCPKCRWNRDLTGAGDLISKPVVIKKENETAAAPVNTEPSSGLNTLIIAALVIFVLAGIFYAFYVQSPKNTADVSEISQTPGITQPPVPENTLIPEVTVMPTGKKFLIQLDSRRGFNFQNSTIKPGDEVVWDNTGKEVVTLVSNEGLFEKRLLDVGKHTSYVFTTAEKRTYTFYLEKNRDLYSTVTVEPKP